MKYVVYHLDEKFVRNTGVTMWRRDSEHELEAQALHRARTIDPSGTLVQIREEPWT